MGPEADTHTFVAFEKIQVWINGHVSVETENGPYEGTLLSFNYDGAIVQGETWVNGKTRYADTYIPFQHIQAVSFTADEPQQTVTTPEYVPGKDNWAGER